MKIRDFVSVTQNKNNKQVSFLLRARNLKRNNITQEQILNIKLPSNIKKEGGKDVWKIKGKRY